MQMHAVCTLAALMIAGQAWAGSCNLVSYGTLPVEMVAHWATTMVKINGADTRFILDTGAAHSIMSDANASALKLHTRAGPFGFRVNGVGGDAYADIATVQDFGILGATLHDIAFIVGGSDMGYGLLGANLLDVADLEIDLAGGKLTLFKAERCEHANLAYWVKEGGEYNVADLEPYRNSRDRRTFLKVVINGKDVRGALDSGASATVLSRSAAKRAGIDVSAPDVKTAGWASGIGAKAVKSWIVPVESFSVGTETIHHSQVQVIDGTLGNDDTEMLLGVDFLLAHRMLIANSVGKAYFTYNGGRVFSLAAAPSDSSRSDVDASADDQGTPPKTASEYALLGESHLSRGETNAAIADLDEAIRMAPDQAAYYVALARAQASVKQSDAALTNLDKSVSLDPKNSDALLFRANLRLLKKDREGAAADVATASTLVPAGSNQARAIAALYMRLDEPTAALPVLDDWIRLHDADARLGSALNERCWARGLSNQMLGDALKDCRKAIRSDGEKPAYLDSLGLIELRLGHYADSIKAYQQAVATQPRSAWSLYGLGLAEIRNGQTDAGNADIAAAQALDPQIEVRARKYDLTTAGSGN